MTNGTRPRSLEERACEWAIQPPQTPNFCFALYTVPRGGEWHWPGCCVWHLLWVRTGWMVTYVALEVTSNWPMQTFRLEEVLAFTCPKAVNQDIYIYIYIYFNEEVLPVVNMTAINWAWRRRNLAQVIQTKQQLSFQNVNFYWMFTIKWVSKAGSRKWNHCWVYDELMSRWVM